MEYIKCPHCGAQTPSLLSRCQNCNELLSRQIPDPVLIETQDVNVVYRKNSYTRLIIFGIIAIIVIIAAIKNPSVKESRQLIKDFAIERVNENVRNMIDDDDVDKGEKFLAVFGAAFAPALIDALIDIDVSDYVLFSTFKATIGRGKESINFASGLILFGKPLLLSSDVKNYFQTDADNSSEHPHGNSRR